MASEPNPVLNPWPQPARLRRLPSWLVNQVTLQASRHTAQLLEQPGVRTDFAVLAALEEYGPLSQAELGRRLGLDRKDVNGVLDRLQHSRQIDRAADAEDRRRNIVTLTPSGRRHLDELEDQLNAVQEQLLAPLNPAERRQLVQLLQRLLTPTRSSS
jgi:DNA-binding MarR family transcriptional regulator